MMRKRSVWKSIEGELKMKIHKQANGKATIKMSKRQWLDLGKKAGWMRISEDEGSTWQPKPPPEDIVTRRSENFSVESVDGFGEFVKYFKKIGEKFSYFGQDPEKYIREVVLPRYEIYAYFLNGSFFGLGFFVGGSFREGIICKDKKEYFSNEYGLRPMAGSSDSAWMEIHNKAN